MANQPLRPRDQADGEELPRPAAEMPPASVVADPSAPTSGATSRPRVLTSSGEAASRFPSVPNAGPRGAVAQLGERLNGIQEADGSIPFSSTVFLGDLWLFLLCTMTPSLSLKWK
jgi:hypothetical protein